jgi:hypothetical protein
MKDHVDKSMGLATRIGEGLARIKPTESLRLTNREARKKRNCSDSSGNSPDYPRISDDNAGIRTIHVYLTIILNVLLRAPSG